MRSTERSVQSKKPQRAWPPERIRENRGYEGQRLVSGKFSWSDRILNVQRAPCQITDPTIRVISGDAPAQFAVLCALRTAQRSPRFKLCPGSLVWPDGLPNKTKLEVGFACASDTLRKLRRRAGTILQGKARSDSVNKLPL